MLTVPVTLDALTSDVVKELLDAHCHEHDNSKRVAGGAREMTTTEVRNAVLDVEEMKAKLRLRCSS